MWVYLLAYKTKVYLSEKIYISNVPKTKIPEE